MDQETFEIAKDNDLNFEEAERLQEIKDETGLDDDDALMILEEL